MEKKLDMRRKQFHVLVASIHQLQAMLDENDSEEIMDVSPEAFEEDVLIIPFVKSEPETMVIE